MKAVLAINNTELENLILTTHHDLPVVGRAQTLEHCLQQIDLHKPELLIISDLIGVGQTWDELLVRMKDIRKYSPQTSVLFLFLSDGTKTGGMDERAFALTGLGFTCLTPPIAGLGISQKIYRLMQERESTDTPSMIAVWSPKPGDGGSLAAEALTSAFWEKRGKEDTIALMDFNLRTPFLKHRLKLEEANILDELLPYFDADCLTGGLLMDHACAVWQREGIRFVGGIRRPELKRRFNAMFFYQIMRAAGQCFAKTVIDAGNILDHPGTVMALKNADVILAVIQPNDVSRVCLQSSMQLFPALGINPNKTRVLLNRYTPETVFPPKITAGGVNLEVLGCLPDLGPEANSIGGEAVFITKRSKETKQFLERLQQSLAKLGLHSGEEKNKKAGLWPQLFSKNGVRYAGK